MLKIQNLCVGYGRVEVLHHIQLEVRAGEIVCIIGANGAGKTTLLNTISGLNKHEKNTVLFRGQELSADPASVAKQRVIQVPEGRKIFPSLSVRENLILGGYTTPKQRIKPLIDEPSLGLAPLVVKEIFDFLKKRNQETGLPMLIVEQNAKVALRIADRAYILETGNIVMEGPAAETARDQRVIDAYFGGKA